jgi:hypothetical protein
MTTESPPLGIAGCQPAAFGSRAECSFAQSANPRRASLTWVAIGMVRGKLPQTAGWQPALPQIGETS